MAQGSISAKNIFLYPFQPLSLGFGWLYRKWCEANLHKLTLNKLVLTYDDGPSVLANGTVELLEVLDELGVRASFYLIGWRAQKNPSICDAIHEGQHELGCHTTRHIDPWQNFDVQQTLEDIRDGYKELSHWLKPDAPFRPPRGHLTAFTWWELHRRGARTDFWSHDSGDTYDFIPDPQLLLNQVTKSQGGVVLMHCHHQHQERIRYTIELTRQLVQLANDRGWEICTMNDLRGGNKTGMTTRGSTVHKHEKL